jgi:hypothetical protein
VLGKNGQFILETERTAFKPYKYDVSKVERKVEGDSHRLVQEIVYTSKFCLVEKNSGSLEPISRLSEIVRSLDQAWHKDMQLFLYVFRVDKPERHAWDEIVRENREASRDHLAKLWRDGKIN